MEIDTKALHDTPIRPNYEIGIALVKRKDEQKKHPQDAVERLLKELQNLGLALEMIHGLADVTFIKVAAPMEVLCRTAERLEMRKHTCIGLELQFDWEHANAFVRQPDNSLFSWSERYQCLNHLIYGVVNRTGSPINLTFVEEGREIEWRSGEPLLERLEAEGVVKEVLPLHDEKQRKELLEKWAFKCLSFTSQPIDAIYSYFGAKVATYFAFLGMYTQWLLFPAVLGTILSCIDVGSWQLVVASAFSMMVISWAALFLQFWKRKNAALLARWGVTRSTKEGLRSKLTAFERKSFIRDGMMKSTNTIPQLEQRTMLQRDEWLQQFISLRNNIIILSGILCLQLPFELAYAHFNRKMESQLLKYALTALYLIAIQYYTKFGGKVSIKLIKTEQYDSKEARADSLVYKAFGLYFVQSFIGLFYHALLHRDITVLRQFLIQRLVVSQVLNNVMENAVPYIKYRYKKFQAFKNKKCIGSSFDKTASREKPMQSTPKIEKEYMKPSYSTSIGEDVEDGLFGDFLELTLQFGMVTMFACAFPLVFLFAALNNLIEIRTDSLKLLAMLRRPIPHAASTIGAWLNIFQFLGAMAICTNCALLVCLYDREGSWKIEPVLATILFMEHALILAKFGLSCFVPEEPAWVKVNRMKHKHAQDVWSQKLLQNIDKIE